MNGVDGHVTNCDNMFLKYDNSINIINQMTTNTTANCVEAKEVKESASTLSNNFIGKCLAGTSSSQATNYWLA